MIHGTAIAHFQYTKWRTLPRRGPTIANILSMKWLQVYRLTLNHWHWPKKSTRAIDLPETIHSIRPFFHLVYITALQAAFIDSRNLNWMTFPVIAQAKYILDKLVLLWFNELFEVREVGQVAKLFRCNIYHNEFCTIWDNLAVFNGR